MKKWISLLLVLTMVFSLGSFAFAEEGVDFSSAQGEMHVVQGFYAREFLVYAPYV